MDWVKWLEMAAAIPIGIAKLFWYFQVPGMLSIAGWLSALAILAAFYRWPRYRHGPYTVALVLALLGFGFGHLNSSSISRIRTDVTEKLNEARTAQEEASRKQVAERRRLGMLEDIHFAEDDKNDVKEREKQADAKKSIYELAAEGKTEQVEERKAELEEGKSGEYEQWVAQGRKGAPPAEAGPAAAPESGPGVASDEPADVERFDYRKGGKRERAADRKEKVAVVREAMKKEEAVGGRLMKEPDVLRAQRLDRVNLFFCRTTLWIALLMLLADYLFRANRTFWTVWPLPVAGRLLDYFYPKQHAVLMEPDSPAFLKGYLETAVRKGESFLYFGESDPWKAPAVLRLQIPPLPEACLRMWETLLGLLEYVGTYIARGYRALIAGQQRRAVAGAAGRGSLAVRAGDALLGVVDAGVRKMGPSVRRWAGVVGRRLREGGLALRMAWVTAQARYPLRLAPIALLLFISHGLAKAFNRLRGKPDMPGGDADRPAGEGAPARRGSLAVRAGDWVLGVVGAGMKRLGPFVRRVAVMAGRRLREGGLALRMAWVTARARYPLRLAPVAMLLFIGHGLAKAFNRLRGKAGAPGGDADRPAGAAAPARIPLRVALMAKLRLIGHGVAKAFNRLRGKANAPGGDADRPAGAAAPARAPLRVALMARLRFAGRGLVEAFDRFRGKLSVPGADPDPFLLGRVAPDRIGCRRWWDRGRFGDSVRWACGKYRRYADAHPRWQEWVERQQARIRRLDAILFREGIWFWVTRLHYDLGSRPADRLFPFEAVWFNRYCCCFVGRDAARAVMPDLLYFLKFRLVPRAQAWQTVNIVWDLALPLERDVVDELAFQCRESNLRLMVVSRDGWAQAMADLFDEKAAEQIGPDDRARIEHMAVLADRIAEQREWAT